MLNAISTFNVFSFLDYCCIAMWFLFLFTYHFILLQHSLALMRSFSYSAPLPECCLKTMCSLGLCGTMFRFWVLKIWTWLMKSASIKPESHSLLFSELLTRLSISLSQYLVSGRTQYEAMRLLLWFIYIRLQLITDLQDYFLHIDLFFLGKSLSQMNSSLIANIFWPSLKSGQMVLKVLLQFSCVCIICVLYVYACFVSVHMCVYMHMSICVWRLDVDVGCLSLLLSILFLTQGLSLTLELTNSAG